MEDSMENEQRAPAARAGRRARAQQQITIDDNEEQDHGEREQPPGESKRGFEPAGDNASDSEAKEGETPRPPRPKRGGFESPKETSMSGYGDNVPRPAPRDTMDSDGTNKLEGVSRRKQDQRKREEEEKRLAKNKYDELVDRANSIENIMEIEEEGKEDLSAVVAEAPKVRTNRVQNISDLDKDMHFRLPSTNDRDIDLSLLTAFLCSSEQVQELDEAWDPDMLFTSVASELHQEKEKAEGPGEKDSKEIDAQAM